MSFALGSSIGAYQILGLLGSGGMGEVYRARDAELGREVALKVLLPAFSSSEDRVARFKREARVLASLNHPNIAQIFGIDQHDDCLVLVMELVEGRDLRDVIAAGPLPIAQVVTMTRQIVDGIEGAHERGIIHRDLKPANIRVRSDGVLKLVDFGLAKAVPSHTADDLERTATLATEGPVVMGTAAYMSPEQARGEAVDAGTDIWAFGCILYELLTQRRAFDGRTYSDTLAALLRSSPDWSRLPAETPTAIRRLLRRCLASDRHLRLRHIGDASLEIDEPDDTDRRRTPTPPRAARLRPALLGLLGGLLAAVAVTVVGWSMVEPAPTPTHERVSFRRGSIFGARFGPDRRSVIFSARFDSAVEIYETRIGRPDARPLGFLNSNVFAVSPKGELAIGLDPSYRLTYHQPARLGRVPLAGGATRELVPEVNAADWTPDGSEVVIARSTPKGARIEWPIGTTFYQSQGTVAWLRVAPDGRRVAFFEYTTDVALVMMDRSGARTVLSDGWLVPSTGLAWAPDNQGVWFTATGEFGRDPSLYFVRPGQTPRLMLSVPGGIRLQDIAPDGRMLLSHLNNSTTAHVRSAGQESELDLSWFSSSMVADLTADSRQLLIGDLGGTDEPGFVLLNRPAGGGAAVRLGNGFNLFGARFSPDGRWVAARTTDLHVRLEPTAAGETKALAQDGWRVVSSLAWTRDSRSLVYVARKEGTPALVRHALDSTPMALGVAECSSEGVIVSPDSRLAACGSPRGLTLHDLNGAPTSEVVTSEPVGTLIGWSSDGRLVFSYRQGEIPGAYYRITLADGRVERGATLMPVDRVGVFRIHPVVVTADEKTIAYSASRWNDVLYVYTNVSSPRP